MLENYCKTILIEANTMVDMAKTEIAPPVNRISYCRSCSNTAAAKKALEAPLLAAMKPASAEDAGNSERPIISVKAEELKEAVPHVQDARNIIEESDMIRDTILGQMGELRVACDRQKP